MIDVSYMLDNDVTYSDMRKISEEKMNDDDDTGNYIKNTLVSNLYNAYLKINNYI